ncbi:hypothetical protein [Agilicoccus flavus]|uniref:hypothetical protein n=1 Tax=Agilicoccus flavus TaxID=2775968 RepID=UPI001CF654E1|nr:hypothetical protein [Agilicoccus flavus]
MLNIYVAGNPTGLRGAVDGAFTPMTVGLAVLSLVLLAVAASAGVATVAVLAGILAFLAVGSFVASAARIAVTEGPATTE